MELDDVELDYALLETWLTEPEGRTESQTPFDTVRRDFHAALVGWFGGREVAANLARIDTLFAQLEELAGRDEIRHLWRLGRAVVEALRDGGLEPNNRLKLLFGRIDRQLKGLMEGGRENQPLPELINGFCAQLGRARSGGPRVTALRAEMDLGDLPLREPEEQTSGTHAARLLQTVAVAIKDELNSVKESLEALQRRERPTPATLRAHTESLLHMADTMGMLKLGLPRRAAEEQAAIFHAMVAGTLEPWPEELLEMARGLLYIEHTLDDFISDCAALEDRGDQVVEALRRIQEGEERLHGGGERYLSAQEYQQVIAATLREARIDLSKVEDAVRAFHDAPWERDHLSELPGLLRDIQGALAVLTQARASALLEGLIRFISEELLERGAIPPRLKLDRLVIVISDLGRFLAAAREGRSDAENWLATVQEGIAELGYPAQPDAAALSA